VIQDTIEISCSEKEDPERRSKIAGGLEYRLRLGHNHAGMNSLLLTISVKPDDSVASRSS